MHQANHVIVKCGEIRIANLPFADGVAVRVTVVAQSASASGKLPISEVRALLGSEPIKFDRPFEPLIEPDNWEMLK